jgi:predicted  nucleic acid-binding Zn-ribbon protein
MTELIKNLQKLQTLEFDKTADASLKKQIAELRSKISVPMLLHYDRLVARGKKGLAGVRNQVCTGCHMQVSRATVMTLMRGDEVQICECCGRYLFLLEEPPVVAPVVKKAGKSAKNRKAKKESDVLLVAA